MTPHRSSNTPRRHRLRAILGIGLTALALSNNVWGVEDMPVNDPDASLASVEGATWMANVTPEQKQKAQVLFDEGRKLFAFPDFIRAEQKFGEALSEWNHPAIHYNLALSLRATESLPRAYEHLEHALEQGGLGLSEARRQDAKRFLDEIGAKVSILEISCREPGTAVTLDNRVVEKTPSRQVLMPGVHNVVATKDGYEPSKYSPALSPGKPAKLETRLYTAEDQFITSYRAPRWMPWTVMGVGAALGVTGGVLLYRSNTLLEGVDEEFNGRSSCTDNGCPLDPAWRDKQNTSDAYKTWATVSFIAGAVAIAGGAVWLPLNKSTRKRAPEELDRQTTVTPILSSNMLGASAAGRF